MNSFSLVNIHFMSKKPQTMKGLDNLQRFSFSIESILWSGEGVHLKHFVLGTENILANMLTLFFFYNSHHTAESSIELSRTDILNYEVV